MGQRPAVAAGRSHGSTPVCFLMPVRGGRGARILRTDPSAGAVQDVEGDADAGATSCWAGCGDAGHGTLSGRVALLDKHRRPDASHVPDVLQHLLRHERELVVRSN